MHLKNVTIFILISVIVVFSSCDPHVPRKMLINDSENIVVNFGGNKIEITAVNWGGWILDYHNSIFYLYMNYDLKRDITIHRDAIHIKYEEKEIENYNIQHEWPIYVPDYKLSGKGRFSLVFTLSDDIEIKKGDKIKITAPNFITYNGDTLSLGELTLEIGKFYK